MSNQTDEFFKAIVKGDAARIDAMVREDQNLLQARNAAELSPVLVAVYNHQAEIVDLLISAGAPLSAFEAAASGRLERVRELVEAKPDLVNRFSPDGYQMIGLAAFFGHRLVVEYLVLKGAELQNFSKNPQQVTPLQSAVAGGNGEIVRILLENGANPNSIQASGYTPLHAATMNGQTEVVSLLLDHGADPNLLTTDGRTALDIAEENGYSEIARLIQQAS
jgi:uncharacterized protein